MEDTTIRIHVLICKKTLITLALRMGPEASGFTHTKEKLLDELGKIHDE